MSSKIYIFGAGGHGKVVAEVAESCGYKIAGFVDADISKRAFNFRAISPEVFYKNFKNSTIALGIGNNHIREKIYKEIKKMGCNIATLIHPNSTISSRAKIEEGTVIMAGAVINSEAKIKKGCIINSGAIIEHECLLKKYTHVAPNASIAGAVKIGFYTNIGIGASVIQCLKIGDNVNIGAGAVVINNIKSNKTAKGVPAK